MASYQDKLDNTIRLMQDRVGLDNIVPGSTSYQMAQSYAYESYIQDLKAEQNDHDRSIADAEGSKLDDIGNNFLGITRQEEIPPFISSSMKVLQFYVSGDRQFGAINGGADIVLPQGTIVSGSINGSVIKFALDSDQVLPASNKVSYVSATLVQGLSDVIPTGTLVNHSFTEYKDYNGGSLKVTNNMQINTGRARQSDDTYRYSINNGLRSFNQANSDGILSLVRNVQGVSDAVVYQAKDGAGTTTVYVKGITPITSDEVIDTVTAVLLQECIPPWAALNVVKPSYIGLTFNLAVTLAATNNINDVAQLMSSIKNLVETYINNFAGSTFYFTDLQRIVFNFNPSIVNVSLLNVYQYVGDSTFRQKIALDISETQSIDILDTEKLIVEPVDNAVIVSM